MIVVETSEQIKDLIKEWNTLKEFEKEVERREISNTSCKYASFKRILQAWQVV